ncbi:MAG: phosphorylase [Roseburia sp.]|nr:phosphorylase [Roseburia sp.]
MGKVQEILQEAKKYNHSTDLLKDIYGIDSKTQYDAVVLAPSWTAKKIYKHQEMKETCLVKHSSFASYEVEVNGKKLAWIQSGMGACNMLDTALCLAESVVDKVIFVGAVGAIQSDILIGELATPEVAIACEGATGYLQKQLVGNCACREVVPENMGFVEKVIGAAGEQSIEVTKRKVFCTDSIMAEYIHLPEIKATGAELIEMETAAFYQCINAMGKKGMALLCVSDNSAADISLVLRDEESTERYVTVREVNVPKLIDIICEL